MDQARSRPKWKDIVIAVLALALLALLVWLFRRPGQPARDIVFGDLGRRTVSNGVAEGVRDLSRDQTNIPRAAQLGGGDNDQPPRREAPARVDAPAGQGRGQADSGSGSMGAMPPENSRLPAFAPPQGQVLRPAPLTPEAPSIRPRATNPPRRFTYGKPAPLTDAMPPPPDPASKDSTVELLAAAKASGMKPENQIPARTADLLGNDAEPGRWFDPESGSNVVFMLDNSLGMMTNGKSALARQEVARTLASMKPDKSFYVVFFHAGGYEGMPSLGPVPATPENVRAMTNWLFSVGHRTGADPTKAMLRALGLEPAPDTVWVLSDSAFPDNVVDHVREANASVHARINTIGLYTRDGEGAMRRIADENRGAYRFVPPTNSSPP